MHVHVYITFSKKNDFNPIPFALQLDRDKDGMVSLDEFIGYTKSDEYKTDEEWKPVVDQDLFSEDDFKKFEDNYDDDYYDYEYDDDGNIVGFKTK